MNRCPVCADNSCRSRAESGGIVVYDCPRCGAFGLPTDLAASLPGLVDSGAVNRSALSHHMRGLRRPGDGPVLLREEDLNAIRPRLRPLPPREQQENLILWLGDNQGTPGQFIQTRKKPLSALIGCHVTSQGLAEPELDWLVNQMKPLGLFDSHFNNQPSMVSLRLTLKGWELYADLRRRAAAGRQAFMPMPIQDDALDQVVKNCFRPVAVQAGFDLVAHNGVLPAALADDRLRSLIRGAPFILADLSQADAGVLFAAGFAEGLGLPVIYTCEESRLDQKDVRAEARRMAAIPWSIGNLDEAAQRLAAIIRATFPPNGRAVH